MDRNELTNIIKKCIAKVAEISENEIDSNVNLIDDLGLSSLEIIEIVSLIEDELDVEIPVDAIQEMSSISDIANFCQKEKKQ